MQQIIWYVNVPVCSAKGEILLLSVLAEQGWFYFYDKTFRFLASWMDETTIKHDTAGVIERWYRGW